MTRPASETSVVQAFDCDLLIGSLTTIATFPRESPVATGTVDVSFSFRDTQRPHTVTLIGTDGSEPRNCSAAASLTLPAGTYRLLIEDSDGCRGVFDQIASRLNANPVFIGTHLPEDQDFRICPLNFWDTGFPTIYGLNLHGQLFSALSRQDFLSSTFVHEDRYPRAWPLITLLVLLPLIVLADTVFLRHGAIRGGLLTLVLAGAWIFVSISLFLNQQLLPIALPLIVFFSFGTSRGYFAYMQARRREQQTRGSFSRFVSARMVDEILKNPNALKPGGEKCELSVMFTDLAGFTSISEMLSPEELTRLMNEYLGEMTKILIQYGGTLDKYIGDAVMAFWNAPMN
ncbi:MAG TPA: adenylate/guanylate cyclase domain-containing protein, partial [Candidatus Ozemobacteraceae bacterium]|nr:adenylate/guanylate cyclase domain-containing protein [Candidatus Ozemobacteraceae bacterium]